MFKHFICTLRPCLIHGLFSPLDEISSKLNLRKFMSMYLCDSFFFLNKKRNCCRILNISVPVKLAFESQTLLFTQNKRSHILESNCYTVGAKRKGFLPPTHKLTPQHFKKKYTILKWEQNTKLLPHARPSSSFFFFFFSSLTSPITSSTASPSNRRTEIRPSPTPHPPLSVAISDPPENPA